MPSHVILAVILMLTVFQRDETLRSYGGAGTEWQLAEINGAPFNATATLRFPSRNVIAGSAPCNSYRSTNTVPFPWFEAGPIAATRMACPDLAAEAAFFEALDAATIGKVVEDRLILSNDEGDLLIFTAAD